MKKEELFDLIEKDPEDARFRFAIQPVMERLLVILDILDTVEVLDKSALKDFLKDNCKIELKAIKKANKEWKYSEGNGDDKMLELAREQYLEQVKIEYDIEYELFKQRMILII